MTSTASSSAADPYLQYDHGLMCVTDSSPSSSSRSGPAPVASVQRSISALLTSMISTLPLRVNPDYGAIISLPLPSTPLPRAKPLPKPKPLTKWQEFARRKGIPDNKKKEGKMVWDDDTKEWVPRWGFKGINKKEEEQWIHEVPANKEDDYDPSKAMKAERKKRKLHNEGQRLKNIQRAAAKDGSSASSSAAPSTAAAAQQEKARVRALRKGELEAGALRNRISTASMGKFDKRLEGEDQRVKGTRRNFDANERNVEDERKRSLAILGAVNRGEKGQSVVNARKAVRFESRGEGALALARKGRGDEGAKRKRK